MEFEKKVGKENSYSKGMGELSVGMLKGYLN
jgi:hypothetical protein